MFFKKLLRKILRKLKFDIIRFTPATHATAKKDFLFNRLGINKVIDVGANVGHYGCDLRTQGFSGEIVSFEPLSSAYQTLEKTAKKYKNWKTKNNALGNECKKAIINISKNSESSSIQDMLKSHQDAAPDSKYIGKEEVTVITFDSIFKEIFNENDKIFLKIDAQGFEKNIIDGAKENLNKISAIQMEMSLVPLYENELLVEQMIANMRIQGFIIVSIEHVYSHPQTNQTLQIDGVFIREDLLLSKF